MNKEINNQLHSAYKNFEKNSRELRAVDWNVIDCQKFDKTAEEYVKSTEQLVKSLDRALNIRRDTPFILTPNPPKRFNNPYIIGVGIVGFVVGLAVTIAHAF